MQDTIPETPLFDRKGQPSDYHLSRMATGLGSEISQQASHANEKACLDRFGFGFGSEEKRAVMRRDWRGHGRVREQSGLTPA